MDALDSQGLGYSRYKGFVYLGTRLPLLLGGGSSWLETLDQMFSSIRQGAAREVYFYTKEPKKRKGFAKQRNKQLPGHEKIQTEDCFTQRVSRPQRGDAGANTLGRRMKFSLLVHISGPRLRCFRSGLYPIALPSGPLPDRPLRGASCLAYNVLVPLVLWKMCRDAPYFWLLDFLAFNRQGKCDKISFTE